MFKKSEGYCHCCRQQTRFESHAEWLRDFFACVKCGSIPRQRHLQHVLDTQFPGWEKMQIHESSPSNRFIAQYADHYTASQLLQGVPLGENFGGVRCENLEKLTLSTNSIDLFISLDVLEHVFHPDLAMREIMRVLKPGGAHVFTAPKHSFLTKSQRRAMLEGDKVIHLFPEEYHGNPVGDGRSLVTWDYGSDFEELLNDWSDSHTTTYVTRDDSLGIDGKYLEVFVTRKSSKPSV
jgi:SAM-dependent methyltransferase